MSPCGENRRKGKPRKKGPDTFSSPSTGKRAPKTSEESSISSEKLLAVPERFRRDRPVAHVFISYVRENMAQVDTLCEALREAGVEVWLDREQIIPGTRWRWAIRKAIRSGSFFIACFSREYWTRESSYMNDELAVAIGELRKHRPDRAWFMPILLSGSEIPEFDIGGGETLRDLQWINLREDWNNGIKRLLGTIHPSLRESNADDVDMTQNALQIPPEKESDDGIVVLDPVQPLPRIDTSSHRRLKALTQIEVQILQAILAGRTNHDIAAELHRSKRTIEVHRSRIMRKLQATSLVDLVKRAFGMGFSDQQEHQPQDKPNSPKAGRELKASGLGVYVAKKGGADDLQIEN
jgi:DNA-binding CsgD family transcriptional regulator